MKGKNKYGVENDIGAGSQQHGHHANGAEPLGIDEAVHPKPDHHENTPQKVNTDILIRIRICLLYTSSEISENKGG